jgi:tetratricopeptide (TPR) repeat protein|tara:strand:- start:1838 stop:2131 length:294 start_codon:yes stop_codon:yes gene_type:complete
LIKNQKNRAITYYNKGTEILMKPEKELIKDAINFFIKAINLDYQFIQAYDNLGKAYRMIEKYDSAIKTYEMSLKVFPSGISAHQNLGIVYEKQKNLG